MTIPIGLFPGILIIIAALEVFWPGHAGSEAKSGTETAIQNILIAITLLAIVVYIPHILKY